MTSRSDLFIALTTLDMSARCAVVVRAVVKRSRERKLQYFPWRAHLSLHNRRDENSQTTTRRAVRPVRLLPVRVLSRVGGGESRD